MSYSYAHCLISTVEGSQGECANVAYAVKTF